MLSKPTNCFWNIFEQIKHQKQSFFSQICLVFQKWFPQTKISCFSKMVSINGNGFLLKGGRFPLQGNGFFITRGFHKWLVGVFFIQQGAAYSCTLTNHLMENIMETHNHLMETHYYLWKPFMKNKELSFMEPIFEKPGMFE